MQVLLPHTTRQQTFFGITRHSAITETVDCWLISVGYQKKTVFLKAVSTRLRINLTKKKIELIDTEMEIQEQ